MKSKRKWSLRIGNYIWVDISEDEGKQEMIPAIDHFISLGLLDGTTVDQINEDKDEVQEAQEVPEEKVTVAKPKTDTKPAPTKMEVVKSKKPEVAKPKAEKKEPTEKRKSAMYIVQELTCKKNDITPAEILKELEKEGIEGTSERYVAMRSAEALKVINILKDLKMLK